MRPFLALDVFPVSLPMFLSEFIFCLYVGSTCTFCFGGKFFCLPAVSLLQLLVVGLGEFPRSVFSLGCMRVSSFSLSFLWLLNPLNGPLLWAWIVSPSRGPPLGGGLPGC